MEARRPSRSAAAGALRLMWIAAGLQGAGLAVDGLFHESRERPFALLDMLWAHGLAYAGAALTVVAGRRLRRATEAWRGQRAAGGLAAILGVAQAGGLALDLHGELGSDPDGAGPAIYVLALGLAVVTTVAATALSRRRPLGPASSPERPPDRGMRAWLKRNPSVAVMFGAVIVAAGIVRIVLSGNDAAAIYGGVQVVAGGWVLVAGLLLWRSRR